MTWPLALALLFFGVLLEVSLLIWWDQYVKPSEWADGMAADFGLKRRKKERRDAWEHRVIAAHKELCAVGDELIEEAKRRGTFTFFPPRQRPSMPPGVTWLTGIGFLSGGYAPFISWLPDAHPVAVRYRHAKGDFRPGELN